jgi:hypothetical protein
MNGFHEKLNRAVYCNLFLPTAHPTLTMAHEGTTQNFALRKGGTKQYVVTKMWILYVNSKVKLIKSN